MNVIIFGIYWQNLYFSIKVDSLTLFISLLVTEGDSVRFSCVTCLALETYRILSFFQAVSASLSVFIFS